MRVRCRHDERGYSRSRSRTLQIDASVTTAARVATPVDGHCALITVDDPLAFGESVTFSTEPVGAPNAQTVMNAAFGGQGFNLVTFRGDGPVIVQSTLHRELEREDREDTAGAAGLRDGILGRF